MPLVALIGELHQSLCTCGQPERHKYSWIIETTYPSMCILTCIIPIYTWEQQFHLYYSRPWLDRCTPYLPPWRPNQSVCHALWAELPPQQACNSPVEGPRFLTKVSSWVHTRFFCWNEFFGVYHLRIWWVPAEHPWAFLLICINPRWPPQIHYSDFLPP